MWCRQCQQDVPAIRTQSGGPACPRCRAQLPSSIDDGGVELESLDWPSRSPALPMTALEGDISAAELRRLRRKLRPLAAMPLAVGQSPALSTAPPPPIGAAPHSEPPPMIRTSLATSRAPAFAGPTLGLVAGMLILCGGVAAVAAHAAGRGPTDAWRWGLAAALAGEGMIAAALGWMTGRLWGHSRRLARRVDAVERQLADERTAAQPDAARAMAA
jgi:hypothetical protein